MTGFITELKRRNVFRVGAAYGVMGWLLIEIASVLLPTFGAPEWVMKVFALLVILGLPLALFLAWAFELTPDGVKREAEVDRSQSITNNTGRKLDRTIIVMLVIALAYFVWDRQEVGLDLDSDGSVVAEVGSEGVRAASGSDPGRVTAEGVDDQRVSIAVLPFVNMSPDPDQEFFADGMTEEILNTLVKVPKLLVAARTSSFAYKGQNTDVRVIGEELGVAHIIEGSVRKAGDDLRITTQLIRVSDGFHLWSESYNRKMDNVFAVQEEIARAVAEALKIPLGLSAPALITNRTTDMEAYELYLRGRQWIRERDERLADGLAAMEKVVAREPEFAPAWAMISISRGLLPEYRKVYQGEPVDWAQSQAIAEQAARRALALDDNLAEGHYALANVLRDSGQWVLAEEQYERAYALDPQSIEIIEDFRQFHIWVGRLDGSVSLSKKGYDLGRQIPLAIVTYAHSLFFVRQYEQAMPLFQQVLELAPGFTWASQIIINRGIETGHFRDALDQFNDCQSCPNKPNFVHIPKILEALANKREVHLTGEQILEVRIPSILYVVGGTEMVLDNIENWRGSNLFFALAYNSAFMDEVRTTQRYKQMVIDVGLVEYWRKRGWPDYCEPLGDDDFKCGAYPP